ncbi:MAG: cupin domain-containing protein [Tannerellaceae bacterium]|jgi:glucose-6-phosphate isomerase|nr:cupin domain-containing protein [Tannerellaceae bacterium]
MQIFKIIEPSLLFVRERLTGREVTKSHRKLEDLKDVFRDRQSCETMPPDTLLYEVYAYMPPDGERISGGLNFGVTHLYPGKVGQEYFMTKGHFHAREDRAEYYWGIEGQGVLILMNRERQTWGERMFPGSLHYIPGGVAHRVANTGNSVLAFGACWPSDAGHNYEDIARKGFAARLMEIDGIPQLI